MYVFVLFKPNMSFQISVGIIWLLRFNYKGTPEMWKFMAEILLLRMPFHIFLSREMSSFRTKILIAASTG